MEEKIWWFKYPVEEFSPGLDTPLLDKDEDITVMDMIFNLATYLE